MGVYKRKSTYWISYTVGHKLYRESARTKDEAEAEEYLKIKLGQVTLIPSLADARKYMIGQLLQSVIEDQKSHSKSTWQDTERRVNKHLEPFFGANTKAVDLRSPTIVQFQNRRRAAGASEAEVNLELAILRRGYILAIRYEILHKRPYIPFFKLNNARQGFIEPATAEILFSKLPDYLSDMIRFAYITGWRSHECRELEWSQVKWQSREVWVYETKNREARFFPFTKDLEELLQRRREATDEEQRRTGTIIPWVFWRTTGRGDQRRVLPINRFGVAFGTACKAAGIAGTIPHDLRRSASRNMAGKGVSQAHRMKLLGHKSECMERRYNIISVEDIRTISQKLDAPSTSASVG